MTKPTQALVAPKRNTSVRKRFAQPRAAIAAATSGEIPRYVTGEEVAVARAKCVSARVRTLIGFLWVTGARISEALALRLCDVDVRNQTVQLVTLKRRRLTYRVLPIPGAYFAELLALVVERQRAHALPSGGNTLRPESTLFEMSRSRAFIHIRQALRMALVEWKRARPHAIRHGHAMHAIKNGVPLNVIQRMMGHSTIFTTSIYLQATADDIRDAHEGIKW